MTYSVKISELPVRASCNATDIVPVVDAAETQTATVTAAQIAAIGGGPPGDGTVTGAKIVNDSVAAAKCHFTDKDRLFSRLDSGAGQGVEIACTGYARGLLAISDGDNARTYLGALQSTDNPTFTGQVRIGNGTAATPAISPTSDTTTGMFFPAESPDSIAFASAGQEAYRFMPDGLILSRCPDEPSTFRARQGAFAWCQFNGTAASGQIVTYTKAQHTIAARYNLTIANAPSALLGVGGSDQTSKDRAAATIAKIKAVEAARGYSVTLEDEAVVTPDASFFSDKYGKVNYSISPAINSWPAYARGTEDRANYYSPGDDTLWYWDTATSSWLRTAATNRGWIGTMTLTSTVTSPSLIVDSLGVVSVTRSSQGVYDIVFERPLATGDNKYCVVATANDQGNPTTGGLIPRLGNLTNTGFTLAFHARATGTATDPTVCCFAVWR